MSHLFNEDALEDTQELLVGGPGDEYSLQSLKLVSFLAELPQDANLVGILDELVFSGILLMIRLDVDGGPADKGFVRLSL